MTTSVPAIAPEVLEKVVWLATLFETLRVGSAMDTCKREESASDDHAGNGFMIFLLVLTFLVALVEVADVGTKYLDRGTLKRLLGLVGIQLMTFEGTDAAATGEEQRAGQWSLGECLALFVVAVMTWKWLTERPHPRTAEESSQTVPEEMIEEAETSEDERDPTVFDRDPRQEMPSPSSPASAPEAVPEPEGCVASPQFDEQLWHTQSNGPRTKVFVTAWGKRFHRARQCQGLLSARRVMATTKEAAQRDGKTPCLYCG